MGKFSLKRYSYLLVNVFFTAVQLYGLLRLNWSGLYVIYLSWVELVFLSLFLGIRYWQLIHSEQWQDPEVYKCITNQPDQIKGEFASFVFSRIYLLLFYLLIIGVTVVPVEKDLKGVETIAQFFANILISEPLFILTALSIIFYYLKLMFAKMSFSKEDLIEFSFNIATIDPKLFTPFLAVFALPFAAVIYSLANTSELAHSNIYFYAMMLLMIRLLLDFYMAYIIRGEIKSRLS